jgi:predicted acylesterase/phospholipase RssA
MKPLERLKIDLSSIETLVFAGGGNRCWWLAGVLNRLFQQRWQLPPFLVGTSAGAAVAASCLTDGPKAALSACIRLYSQNTNLFDWHGRIYLQPSQRVPVSTWDCRKDTHVMGAFALGERDAAMLL